MRHGKPLFITGNQDKADYLSKMLRVALEHKKLELDELQSTSLDTIVTHKVKQAYQLAGVPVLVEDVALEFHALDGLPGPFIKYFVDSSNGLENLCRMLDGFEDRGATARCTFGYYDGKNLQLFQGSLDGTIALSPKGSNGFGWDKIFCPEGYGGLTRAELGDEDNEKTYTTIKPFAKVREYLSSKDA